MNSNLNDLKKTWQDAKEGIESQTQPASRIISLAKRKIRSSLYFHYGNIAILTLTLIALYFFFYHLVYLQEMLSRIGIAFMLGGLVLRIGIEVFSVSQSLRIDLSDHALKNTHDTLAFYQFRKNIHGPVTIAIVGIYTLGFYLLTPEFSKHLALRWMVLIDSSYIIGAILLIWQIRKGIRKEMENLAEVLRLKAEMT